mgnify:FL=1
MNKLKKILLAVALFLPLGCGSATNVLYPLYPWPDQPQAITEPEKTFIRCGDDFYCVSSEHLDALREFVIEQNGVIEKYHALISKHNGSIY